MKNQIMRTAVIMLAMMLIAVSAFAEIPKPSDDFWYYDSENVLSAETEGEIYFANQSLYDASGAEIVVVCTDSTGDMRIEDYTYQLFNDWNIGKDTYLGMLLVMAIGDDDYYAMTGTRLEALIPAGDLSEMLNTYLEPDFAAKDYDAGAQKFFEAAYARVCSELNLDLKIADAKRQAKNYIAEHTPAEVSAERGNQAIIQEETTASREGGSVMGYIIVIIILLIVLSSLTRSRRRRRMYYDNRPPIIVPPFGPRRHRNPPPPPMGGFGGPPPRNDRPPMGGFGGPSPRNNRPPVGGAPRGGSFGGFGGASRGGRSGGFSGGFGGASRHSGGGGHGPVTRGGGAGRGR